LLGAGGSDHPMTLLKAAGVDLSEPSTCEPWSISWMDWSEDWKS
jgi:oligoendopeptidase F